MIKVYYNPSCSSSAKLLEWLKKYNISAEIHRSTFITRNDLLALLILTDKGLQEILKEVGKTNTEGVLHLKKLETLSFNEGVSYLLSHTNIIKTPIILDKNKYMIGFNTENVRQFLPQEYRRRKYYS